MPSDFTGPYLALRIRFYYNPDENDIPDSKIPRVGHLKSTPPVPQLKVRPGIKVSIYPPTNLEVPQGGSTTLTPLVTGTGNRDNGVEWSVSGFGCSGVACGQMTNDTYQAPTAMPNPPFVTLTASSKADPSAKASVTVHIFASGSPADKSLLHSETHTTYIDTNFGTVVMEYCDAARPKQVRRARAPGRRAERNMA